MAAIPVQPAEPRQEALWVRSIERATQFGSVLSGIAAGLLGINVLLDVALRAVAKQPLPGTLDLVSYVWMPCLALLALGFAQMRDEQIRVTLAVDLGTPNTRRALAIASEALTGVLAVWMTVLAVESASYSLEIGESTVGAPWLVVWPVRMIAVLAFGLFALSTLARSYRIANGEHLKTEIEQETEAQNDL